MAVNANSKPVEITTAPAGAPGFRVSAQIPRPGSGRFSLQIRIFPGLVKAVFGIQGIFQGNGLGKSQKGRFTFSQFPVKRSGTFEGHLSAHLPQAMHFLRQYTGAVFRSGQKAAGVALRSRAGSGSGTSIFGWPAASTSLGENMQVEQSLAGKFCPVGPWSRREGGFSTRWT